MPANHLDKDDRGISNVGSPFVARLAGSETVSELVNKIFITEPKHAQKSQSYSHMNLIFNWSH